MNEFFAIAKRVGADDARPIHRSPPRFRVRIETGSTPRREIVWSGARLTVGSDPDVHLHIDDPGIAPIHCEILAEREGFVLRAVGGGTWLGGVKIREALLPTRSSIRVGETRLSFAVLDHSDGPHVAFGRLVGRSQVMRDAIERLRSIAAHDATLLIEGQSGTGKEVAAEAVHQAGPRRNGPFVVVDCAAIARSLIEAELFGHERGAYTGATHARPGAFVKADGGTLFLDEIGELDLELQPRLLRLIERREVKPLGGSTPRRVDVRIIAATNRDLAREAARGTFRADLYYRLAVTCVRMPALSERTEDIPLLCRHIADELADRGLDHALGDEELQALARQHWPGNVRELKNAVERLATLGGDRAAPDAPRAAMHTDRGARLAFRDAKARLVSGFERQYLTEVMAEHEGNITSAAHAARVDRVHFLRLLDKHGMRKHAPRD